MISSIGSSSAGYDTASIQQMRSQLAEKLFKTADANQDGKVIFEDTVGELLPGAFTPGDLKSES